MMGILFEACVDSVHSAVQAAKGGAGRLELCGSLMDGGITPSYGLIKTVQQSVTIPVHVLVRPRVGDFCYMECDIDVITEDIRMIGTLGVQGIAFGALTVEGDIDMPLMESIMSLCRERGLSVTFHRAFDATRSPSNALEELIRLGVPRVLTSGQRATVNDGLPVLKMLVETSKGRICIMPGGGVNEKNAASIVQVLGVSELHGSASSPVDYGASFGHDSHAEIRQAFGSSCVRRATDWMIVSKIVSSCKQTGGMSDDLCSSA